MATIDELVISLSLDARKFNEQQQLAVTNLRKFEQQATVSGTNVERGAQKMVDGFSRVTKEILGVGAAILGVNGLKDLAVNLTTMAAATERMAGAFEIEPETLNKWQEFFKAVGQQDFSTTSSSLGTLSKAIQEYRATLQGPLLAAIPWLAKLHISPADITAGTPSQALNTMLLKAGANINNPENRGIQAEILSHIPGMTPPMMESLKTAPTQKVLDSYLSATAEQMRAAAHMMTEIEDLARTLRKKLNTYLPDADRTVTALARAGKKAVAGDLSGAFTEEEAATAPMMQNMQRQFHEMIVGWLRSIPAPGAEFSRMHPGQLVPDQTLFPNPGPIGGPVIIRDTSAMPQTGRFPDGSRRGGSVTNNITAYLNGIQSNAPPQEWADAFTEAVRRKYHLSPVPATGGGH